MAHSDRHLHLVRDASPALAGARPDDVCPRCGIHRIYQNGNPDACGEHYRHVGCLLAKSDPPAPREDVVVPRSNWDLQIADAIRRAPDYIDPLSALDYALVDPSAEGSEPIGLVADWERANADLPDLWAGVCRREASRLLRIALLGDRDERPVPRHLPDGLIGTSPLCHDRIHDGVPADRRRAQLLRSIRLATLGLRVGGPVRYW